MSSSPSFSNNQDRTDNYNDRESLSPREQMLGALVVMLVIVLAILLRSL